MSDEYENVRLETPAGEIVAYLAPNVETTPTLDNDLFTQPVRGSAQISRDLGLISQEITAQGTFEHTDNLPSSHSVALFDVFGTAPVTAIDQIQRVWNHAANPSLGGPFHFYWRGIEFTATDDDDVDYANGVFPAVQISQFRPPFQGGFSRGEYTLQLSIGRVR